MRGFLIGFSKLVLGVTVALLLLSLAGVATARYFMARLSVLPPRPVFENDAPVKPTAASVPTAQAAAAPAAAAAPTPTAVPLPPGAYEAVVVQPIGLVLREGPGTNFSQLGGIDYNDEVAVLEESPDKQWMKVRVAKSGQEGWVKAGNVRKSE